MTRRPTRRERLQVIFAFLVLFGGTMFVVSPEPTRAQVVFRLSLVLVGLAGFTRMSRR